MMDEKLPPECEQANPDPIQEKEHLLAEMLRTGEIPEYLSNNFTSFGKPSQTDSKGGSLN